MENEGPCLHCQIDYSQLWRRGPPEKPVLCNACGSCWERNGTLEDYTPEHGMHDGQSGEPKSVLPSNTTSSAPVHAVEIPELSGSDVVGHDQPSVVSPEEIELVQNLIERCLQLYMSRDEVVKTLSTRARIHPEFTTVVWQKLEEQNAAFFRAYYISLELKKQITLFNRLLEHQSYLMRDPLSPEVALVPISGGIDPMAVDNLPMGDPVLQHPPVPVAGQPHHESIGCGISSPHGAYGEPLPGNFLPMKMNCGNDLVMDGQAAEVAPAIASSCGVPSTSEMPLRPTSAACIGQFPFSASDMSSMGVNTRALKTAFSPDNGAGHSGNWFRSLDQFPWNFSPLDLPADFSNLGDLGLLPNYPGFPFLPPNSDILDFPELGDTDPFFSDDFFADLFPGSPGSLPDEDGSKIKARLIMN